MMNKIKALFKLFFSLLILFFSCKNEVNKEFNEIFPFSKKLISEKNFDLQEFMNGRLELLVNDTLALFFNRQSSPIFYIYNLKSEKILTVFGSFGKGPNEYSMPRYSWYDKIGNQLSVYDLKTKNFYFYNLDSLLEGNKSPQNMTALTYPNNVRVSRIMPYNQNSVLGTGSFEKGSMVLFDFKEEKVIEHYGEYYMKDEDKGVSNEVLGRANQGRIFRHPTCKKFLLAQYFCGHLEFFTLENGEFNISTSYKIHPVLFEEKTFPNGFTTAAYVKENRIGFIDIAYNDNLIFALYSGRSMQDYGNESAYGRDVYVFTWEGEPIAHYLLEKDANSLAICNNSKNLYVLFIEDDFFLQRFNLNLKM